jgi:hypothetical protein
MSETVKKNCLLRRGKEVFEPIAALALLSMRQHVMFSRAMAYNHRECTIGREQGDG